MRDDIIDRTGFAEEREDVGDAVGVGVRVEVDHRIKGDCHVEAGLVSLTGGGFDTDTGGGAADHDLGDAEVAEPAFEVR